MFLAWVYNAKLRGLDIFKENSRQRWKKDDSHVDLYLASATYSLESTQGDKGFDSHGLSCLLDLITIPKSHSKSVLCLMVPCVGYFTS